jgi:hypothetical protein
MDTGDELAPFAGQARRLNAGCKLKLLLQAADGCMLCWLIQLAPAPPADQAGR